MFIDCSKSTKTDLYKILIGSIIPRPIAWVSTRSVSGVTNLAPFSFFNCMGVDPPILAFAPGYKSIVKDDGSVIHEPKDTLKNIKDTEQFVVNLVSRDIAEKMNQSSAEYPADISEFDAVGVTASKSAMVMAPGVVESMVQFECKLIQIIQHGHNNLVLGEILCMNVSDAVIDARGRIKSDVLQAVGRMGGDWYTSTTEGNFALKRPLL